MPGPKNTHTWHDSFDGTEPTPAGASVQANINTPKNIVAGHAKPGPRSPRNPSKDTFSE